MSTLQLPERPAFNSRELELDADLSPPVSWLAILALLLGLASLITIISVSIIPLALIIAVICAAITWRLAYDTSVSGLRLAQAGLCCSIIACGWVVTSTKARDSFYYTQGAQHAQVFLDLLSAGKKYDAFELTLDEAERQITGTDLEVHYQQLMDAPPIPKRPETIHDANSMEMPSSQALEDGRIKEALVEFLATAGMQEVLKHGEGAQWSLAGGDGIEWTSSNAARVQVVMVDKVKPEKRILVTMLRKLGQYMPEPGKPQVAIWSIERTKVVKE